MARPVVVTAAAPPARRALTRRSPVPAALLVLALSCIGAGLAITQRLAYGFGGHGHANDVLGDFLHGGGTALSPPLPTLVVLALCTFLTTRRGWPAIIGLLALVIAAGAFTIATIGEPLTRRALTPEHFEPLKAALASMLLLAATAMGVLAALTLARRRHEANA